MAAAHLRKSLLKRLPRFLRQTATARPRERNLPAGPALDPARDASMAPDALRLHLGCNRNAKPGYVNVDIQRFPGVDMVADLEKSWPWRDETFEEVVCADVPEHLRQWYEEPEPAALDLANKHAADGRFKEAIESVILALRNPRRHYGVIHFMEEAYRVLRPGGRLDCTIPSTDGRGWAQDPTHVSYWNENCILYFLDGDLRRIYPSLIRSIWKRIHVETLKSDRHGVVWFRMILQKEPHNVLSARSS